MLHRFKLLTTSAAIAALISMSGCVVNPGNSQGNSYNHNGNNAAQEIKNVLVYDLKDKNFFQAENQLRDRGYSEYGREGSHSWWFNEQNKQCYEFEEENNKVHKIHLKGQKDCENAPGSRYGRHNNYNNNYSQQYNSGNNNQFGQTPNSLSDMVGARAGQAEGELSRRGYQFSRASNSNYGQTGFWRENHSGACVSIVTNEGRFQSIVYTAPDACN
jgi:hypothetical protein